MKPKSSSISLTGTVISYVFSLYFFVMVFTGGTTSRTGAGLNIEPLTAALVGACLFALGTLLLAISIGLRIARSVKKSRESRWRGRSR